MNAFPPPREMGLLVDALDEVGALRVVEVFGGRRLYVPVGLKPAGELAKGVGLELATALTSHFGGDEINVPLAREWRCMIYRNRYNWTIAQIASKLSITEGAVYKIIARRRPGATAEQLSLL